MVAVRADAMPLYLRRYRSVALAAPDRATIDKLTCFLARPPLATK
ncbi:MAG TPA: hypothetical protein VJH94_00375 [Candidatus Paceibacterota bacterium]